MRRPRFSLLSMVLFTLLCGSAVALWLHWPAWRVVARVRTALQVCQVNSSLILVQEDVSNQYVLYDTECLEVHRFSNELDLYRGQFSDDGQSLEFWPKKEYTLWFKRWNIRTRAWDSTKRFTEYDKEELSPSWRYVLSRPNIGYSTPGSFRLFDASTGKVLKRWKYSSNDVLHVEFDRSSPGVDCVWLVYFTHCERLELPTFQLMQSFPSQRPCEFSLDGRWIAHMDPNSYSMILRDAKTGAVKSELTLPPPTAPLYSVQLRFSANSEMLCSVDGSGEFCYLWNLKTLSKIDLETDRSVWRTSGIRYIANVRFEKDDEKVIAISAPQEQLLVWSSTSGKLLYQGTFQAVDLKETPFRVIDRGWLYEPERRGRVIDFPNYAQFFMLPNDHDRIVAKPEITMGDPGFHVLTRFRPEAWWGVAWLPEFWSTVVFAGLFVWNIIRGRRGVVA